LPVGRPRKAEDHREENANGWLHARCCDHFRSGSRTSSFLALRIERRRS
jgi:hypothetical protein